MTPPYRPMLVYSVCWTIVRAGQSLSESLNALLTEDTSMDPISSLHSPDRFMVDLRQVLSQARKRIGLLIGAGAPVSIIEGDGPLIPDVTRLTEKVLDGLDESDQEVVKILCMELGGQPNVEDILTRIRQLSLAIGGAKVHGLDGGEYKELAKCICQEIGGIVNKELPPSPNSFTQLAAWVAGTDRNDAIEIFTPNYDLLLEQAFERAKLPYFDGFTGAHKPFFDPPSIENDTLPSRWTRIWKIHGSLGWDLQDDTIIRTGKPSANMLIYPDHLKYEQISRQPYSALFERFRRFLMTPDSLLMCSGFSFSDAQITSVIDETLSANSHTAVVAFQFGNLKDSPQAVELALRRPNVSVYAEDGAVIFGVEGCWSLGDASDKEWEKIRNTFWVKGSSEGNGKFLLGDFACLARFLALARAPFVASDPSLDDGDSVSESPETLEEGVPNA